MHPDSLLAWYEELYNFSRRERQIVREVTLGGHGTDREIMLRLGRIDMNDVRPRITELIKEGVLYEENRRKCYTTGKIVRVVDVKRIAPQQPRLI